MVVEIRKPQDQLFNGGGRIREIVTVTVLDCVKAKQGYHVVCWLRLKDRIRLHPLGVNATTIEFMTDEIGSHLFRPNDWLEMIVSATTPNQRVFIGESQSLLIDSVESTNPAEVVRRLRAFQNERERSVAYA